MAETTTTQILIPVAVALLAGGTAPWWISAFRKSDSPKPQSPANPDAHPQTSQPPQPEDLLADPQKFVVGRWRMDRPSGQFSGGTTIDYMSDGRFSGQIVNFEGDEGKRQSVTGSWTVEKQTPKTFRLNVVFSNGDSWQAMFKVLNANCIENMDENYVAEREE